MHAALQRQVLKNGKLILQEAEAAERADPPMVNTCREIVRAVIDYGVEKDDWKKTWKADARVSSSTRESPLFRMCNESGCTWHYERFPCGVHM